MRILLLCCALLLTAVPFSSAHDDRPVPPERDPGTCPQLPLWDLAVCSADRIDRNTQAWGSYALAMASYAHHQAGCHVVGGPACTA